MATERRTTCGIAFTSLGPERAAKLNGSGPNRFSQTPAARPVVARQASKTSVLPQGKYKLNYFNARGRGEVVRLVFAAAGIQYEDNRIEFKDWPEIKPKSPTGFLPYLEIPGRGVLTQSGAIARYLAKQHGLAGKDDFDEARVDMIMNCFVDLATDSYNAWFEQDGTRKEEMMRKVKTETVPNGFGKLENLVESNYFVGNALTLADLVAFDFITGTASQLLGINMAPFPKLSGVVDKVKANSRISEWLSKRPATEI